MGNEDPGMTVGGTVVVGLKLVVRVVIESPSWGTDELSIKVLVMVVVIGTGW
jgi:TRAP-type C4-dicarboxylate transport system permease small subunit